MDERTRVLVTYDGLGLPPGAELSGLANLADRARGRGGDASVEPLPDGGTRLRWWAPLR